MTGDAIKFVHDVSQQTGVDPRVLTAWVELEGADAPNGTGHFNFLNLRPYPGDPYSSVSSGNFEQFSSEQDAVAATVRRLGQPFASPIVQGDTGRTPRDEIAAIAGTGWDAGHYGGGGGRNLLDQFSSIFGSSALDSNYSGPSSSYQAAFQDALKHPIKYGGVFGSGAAAGGGVGAATAAAGAKTAKVAADAAGSLSSVGKALTFLFSYRGLEVIGGGILIIVGIVGLMKEVGVKSPKLPGPAGKAVAATE